MLAEWRKRHRLFAYAARVKKIVYQRFVREVLWQSRQSMLLQNQQS